MLPVEVAVRQMPRSRTEKGENEDREGRLEDRQCTTASLMARSSGAVRVGENSITS